MTTTEPELEITLEIVVPPVLEFINVNTPPVEIPPVPIVNKLAVVLVIVPPPALTVNPLVYVAADPV